MPARQADKYLDRAIEQAYYRLASGQQINITDIPKVFALARKNVVELQLPLDGTPAALEAVNQAVRAAVLMYCEDANKGLTRQEQRK